MHEAPVFYPMILLSELKNVFSCKAVSRVATEQELNCSHWLGGRAKACYVYVNHII